jgi:hypothetical protein
MTHQSQYEKSYHDREQYRQRSPSIKGPNGTSICQQDELLSIRQDGIADRNVSGGANSAQNIVPGFSVLLRPFPAGTAR